MPVNRSSLVLPSILCIALLLRLPLLNGSFWLDEAAQALESVRPLSQQLDIIPDFQPPLLHFILHFATRINTSEWFLRTIGAVIPGLITIGYTYAIGRKLFSQKVAVLSALLLSTSSLHIFFSQELRPYALPAALATASAYYFFSYLETKKLSALIALAVLNAFGLYSSYLYPFFMIGQAVLAATSFSKKQLLQYGGSLIASGASFLPLLPLFLRQLNQGGMLRTQVPGWDQVVSIPQLQALPLVIGKFVFGVLPLDATPLVITLSIGLLGAAVLAAPTLLATIQDRTKRAPILKLALLFAVPILSAWIISFWVPVIQPKRVLYLLPYWYLLLTALTITKKSLLNVGSSLILALFAINLITTGLYYTKPELQRENWRALHTQIRSDFSREKSILIFGFPAEFAPIAWYEREQTAKMAILTTGILNTDLIASLDERFKGVVEYETVLVFDYLRDLTDPQKKIERTLMSFGFKEVGVLEYPHIGFVRIFARPAAVLSMEHRDAYWR